MAGLELGFFAWRPTPFPERCVLERNLPWTPWSEAFTHIKLTLPKAMEVNVGTQGSSMGHLDTPDPQMAFTWATVLESQSAVIWLGKNDSWEPSVEGGCVEFS